MQQMDGATMAAMLKSRFGDSVKVSPDTEQVELTEEQLAEINSNAAADEQEGWWKNSTYDIVSRAGYLLGVPLRIFENEFSPMMMEIYEELQKNREARIIRNLCILRTAILQKFKKINHAIYYDLKNLYSLPEYIPQDALKELSELGINIIKATISCKTISLISIIILKITSATPALCFPPGLISTISGICSSCTGEPPQMAVKRPPPNTTIISTAIPIMSI